MGVGIEVFFNDPIVVETWLGEDGQGNDRFAAAKTVLGYSEQRRTLVRTGDSETAMGQTVVYTALANSSLFTTGSRVTINTIVSKVITASEFNSSGLPLPEHTQVILG